MVDVSLAVTILLGLVAGTGIWLTVGAAAGWRLLPTRAAVAARAGRLRARLAASGAAVLAGTLVLALTGWPVGGLLAALATLSVPRLIGGGQARAGQIARTEAIAGWAESLRDTMAAAAGLEEAIVATAAVPPAPIADQVRLLAERVRHQRLTDALAAFGRDLDHPSADLVVAALTIAARLEAADLTGLLGRLAVSIRQDATMRVKVEVSRARLRTSAKIILGSVAATLALLLLLNRSYLDAYDSVAGQAVLAAVGGIFAAGGWLLARMSEIALPDRFVPRDRAGRT